MQAVPKKVGHFALVMALGCVLMSVPIVRISAGRGQKLVGNEEDSGHYSPRRLRRSVSADAPTDSTERVEHLRKFCSKASEGSDRTSEWTAREMIFYAVPSYKALFCILPKTGSTSFKYLLMKLASNSDDVGDAKGKVALSRHNITMVPKNVTAEEILDKFSDYTKILTVRQPLARIVSAYKSKLIDKGDMTTSLIIHTKRILQRRRRRNMTNLDSHPLYKDTPTFEEFISYVTEVPATDPHWMSQFSLSQPCSFQYDIINTVESLDSDIPRMLSKLNARKNITLETANKSVAKPLNMTDKDFLNTLSPELFQKLISAYSVDFEAFGYDMTEYKSQ